MKQVDIESEDDDLYGWHSSFMLPGLRVVLILAGISILLRILGVAPIWYKLTYLVGLIVISFYVAVRTIRSLNTP